MKLFQVCLLNLTLLFCNNAFAQQIFSQGNSLRYAESLACEGEYELALKAIQPHIQTPGVDSLLQLYLYCLYQMQENGQLFQTLKVFLQQKENPDWLIQSMAAICIEKDSATLLMAPSVWPKLDPILQIRTSIWVQNDTLTRQLLRSPLLKKDSVLYCTWDQQIKTIRKKTPAGLILASAIIPGSGKVILGDTYDGFVGFGLSGIYSFLTYRSYQLYGGRSAFTWINLGFALAFYGGNILGTQQAFKRKNTYRLELIHHEIKANLYSSYFHLPCH